MPSLESLAINPFYSFYIKLALSSVLFFGFVIFRRVIQGLIFKFFSKTNRNFPEIFDDITKAIEKPIDVLWVVTGLYLALLASPFVNNPTLTQPDLFISEHIQISLALLPINWIHEVYGATVIALIGWSFHNLVDIYEKVLLGIGSRFTLFDNALIIRFTAKLLKSVIIITTILLMVNIFIPLTTFVASVGILGAALTFIAKDTLTDILSGIVLMIDKPFTIGDWIQLSSIEGVVEDVTFRSTRIRTFEQGVVVVPNTTLSNDNIVNWSSMHKRRHRFTLGVTYDTSSDTLHTFIEDIKQLLHETEGIDQDSFLVYFDNFGDFSLNIIIQYFTFQTDLKSFSGIKQDVNMRLLALANEKGISIAFPTQTIHLEQGN